MISDHPGWAGRCGPGRVPALGRWAGPRPQGWGPAGRAAETLRGGWGTLGGGWVLWPPGPISGAHRVGLRRRGCGAEGTGLPALDLGGRRLTAGPSPQPLGSPLPHPSNFGAQLRGGGHYLGDGFSSLLPPAHGSGHRSEQGRPLCSMVTAGRWRGVAWGRGLAWRGSHRRRCLGARRRRPEGGRCCGLVKMGAQTPSFTMVTKQGHKMLSCSSSPLKAHLQPGHSLVVDETVVTCVSQTRTTKLRS